jgi:hypothetical protein
MDPEKGTATIEFVIGECHKIFNDIKNEYKKTKKIDEQFCDELHGSIIKKYKNFAEVYPLVLRHIVYEKKFYPDVMKKFLLHVSNHPITSRDESLEVQAEYLVYMLRYEHPKCDRKKIYEYRNQVIKSLKDDDKKLEQCIKDASEEMQRDKELGNTYRREKLKEYLTKSSIKVDG